ncbi:unnamed protein product [Colias eurytheme]|nr:unnamed protein product [Colias eurytheme]
MSECAGIVLTLKLFGLVKTKTTTVQNLPKMRMTNKNQRSFYVVQFIELPFDGIDDYVCVPYSWIIFQKSSSRKIAVVTYPNNEDPLETRERVRRKERPNDSWRFYMAYLKYESDDLEDGELWIAKNEFGPIEQVGIKKKDIKTEPQLNRKLRSASQSCWSETNSDKPQITVKPYNNPRKPLPRISIRRPLSPDPDQSLNNKCLKSNENSNPGILTDHITPASDSSKQKKSIIITGNQPPTKQKLSLQSPTVRKPSPQPPIDQPSPKFIAEQHSSSKFSATDTEQPTSSNVYHYQRRPSFFFTNGVWWLVVLGLGGTAVAFTVLLMKFLSQVPVRL